ncbi:MAG: Crp/Fnr family transcriptional regulator [Atribacterota bacterium]|nr:Crp/Fnr family transcriptional regulator [Atribacterota bacterium]
MFDVQHSLSKNILFKEFTKIEINQFLVYSNYKTIDYQKNQVVALEGDPLTMIGLVLAGTLEIQKHYSSGKKVIIDKISTGDIFGEVSIFSSKNIFPSTITSITDSRIMFVKKNYFVKMCYKNKKFLQNLLQSLSEKILLLDNRLRFLASESIRQKISLYLLEEYKKNNTLRIRIDISREKMAEQFGITRPSLSREISRMKKEGIIQVDKNVILIKNLSCLEKNL